MVSMWIRYPPPPQKLGGGDDGGGNLSIHDEPKQYLDDR